MRSRFLRAFSSSVGTKLLIGLTGLALFAYMVLHLAGNALILAGPDIFNEYSHTLISNPLILPIELGLLAVFLVHIYKAIVMWRANRAARPVGYLKKEPAGHTSRKSLASSTMIASGLFLLLFVIVHVKQFKFGPGIRWSVATRSGISTGLKLRYFEQPLWVLFYVAGSAAGRPAPSARDRQRLSVARDRSSGLHAEAEPDRDLLRDPDRRRAGGDPGLDLLYLLSVMALDAKIPAARSRTNGTGTASNRSW